MPGNDFAELVYLLLFGGVLMALFFVSNRQSMSKTLQQASIWALIFVGAIAAVGMWEDIRQSVSPRQTVYGEEGRVEVPRSGDGHFYLTVEVNGTPVDFVVDTGATDVVLSRADARRVGLDPDRLAYTGQAYTANGVVEIAPVRLSQMQLGPFEDSNIRASVNGGALDISLLGMEYLERFDRLEISRNLLTLSR